MAKLHEVLAVEAGLNVTAKNTNQETVGTFRKRDEHFMGSTRMLEHFAEQDHKLNVTEHKPITTTVIDKLLYNQQPNIRAWDAYLQKEATNQIAKADITIDGTTLVQDVPSTALLGLESRLNELREVYREIPTLAPGHVWQEDRDARANGGIYNAKDPDTNFRTKRLITPVVMAPATEHHPAQVQAVPEDVPIAKITTYHTSGMITSAQKSDLLGRIDKLLRAVKRARQRANNADVERRHIGKTLFDYIHGDIVV